MVSLSGLGETGCGSIPSGILCLTRPEGRLAG